MRKEPGTQSTARPPLLARPFPEGYAPRRKPSNRFAAREHHGERLFASRPRMDSSGSKARGKNIFSSTVQKTAAAIS